ncbi:MAG TPA: mechanosensitive ion channel family protein [Gaiellaceae bacterium]|nr:mechanosensitive ion channel family protein [Gaiellaceae bacterium]
MSSLVDLLNDSTPLSAPLGQLIVIAAVFFAAWLVGRAAGRIASFFVLRGERRHAPDFEDTGVIASLKQRETAISLGRATVRATIYVLAGLLSLSVLVGADRIETIAGASFLVILLAFAAQRFLADVIAGLLMFHERWFRIGDTIVIEPWKVEGVVEELTLRAVTVRSAEGEVMRVSNSEVKAVRVLPRGFREAEIELFVSDEAAGRELLSHVARIVPSGPTHFLRRPAVVEVESLEEDLHRVRARAAVPSGRAWLALELLPSLMRERADDGLIVHGPVVAWVDEQAEQRFARAVRVPVSQSRW